MHQVFFCLQQGLFLRLEFQVANYTKNTFQFEEAFADFMKFLPFWLMGQNGFFQVVILVLFIKKNIIPDNGLELYACNGYLMYKL